MYYEFRRLPVSRFREEAGKHMDWVETAGGHLWLTRHGKHTAAVIPFYQMKVLEEVLGQSEASKAQALEAEYARFRAAKAIQAAEERARLASGLQVGGGLGTPALERTMAQGRDPWADDPTLIMPGRRAKGFRPG